MAATTQCRRHCVKVGLDWVVVSSSRQLLTSLFGGQRSQDPSLFELLYSLYCLRKEGGRKRLLGVFQTGLARSAFGFGRSGGSSGEGAPPPPGESPEEIEKQMMEMEVGGVMEEQEAIGAEEAEEVLEEGAEETPPE